MCNTNENRMTNPHWVTSSELINFKVVNEPLEKVLDKIINTFEMSARQQYSEFNFSSAKILSGCYQTYKAIRKLVAKDPKYPTQAHILNRSLLDSIFVLEAFSEDIEKYPKSYTLAGYRMMWEEYTKESEKHKNDPDWKDYLSEKEKFLESSAENNGLSVEERKSPQKHIRYWPIPSRMLKEGIFSKEKHEFLKELYDCHYSWESALSHFQWAGMAATYYSSKPESHLQPGKYESDAVYKSILYLLMIISVIESVSEIGIKPEIKYIWTIVGSYWKEAKHFYDKRYINLLKE